MAVRQELEENIKHEGAIMKLMIIALKAITIPLLKASTAFIALCALLVLAAFVWLISKPHQGHRPVADMSF
jgi:hypothetical protein